MRGWLVGAAVAVQVCCLALVGPATAESAPAVEDGNGLILEYDSSADAVVLRYRRVLGEIGGDDRGPGLTLFGDGRLLVHYPIYMTRRGDWTVKLARAEMDALLRSIAVDRRLVDFDRTAAARELKNAKAGELFYISDPDITDLELHLTRFRRQGDTGEIRRDIDIEVEWGALQVEARRHPGIEALDHLAAIERDLLSMMERDDLSRVE